MHTNMRSHAIMARRNFLHKRRRYRLYIQGKVTQGSVSFPPIGGKLLLVKTEGEEPNLFPTVGSEFESTPLRSYARGNLRHCAKRGAGLVRLLRPSIGTDNANGDTLLPLTSGAS